MVNWCPNEEDNQYDKEALGPDFGYLVLKVSDKAKLFQILSYQERKALLNSFLLQRRNTKPMIVL
jgi:hypothetical protein